jgi:hypothetical protein
VNVAAYVIAIHVHECFILQEARDHLDSFEQYKEEMSDLAETVEIATLDKEMAEEKVCV